MKEKSKYGMPPPISRIEMEHNVFMLIDELQQHAGDEDFLANRVWALGDSLRHIRPLPNGRIELAAIDERIRCFSNLLGWMKYFPSSD